MYELVIEADTNDGDYVTSTNEITAEQVEELKPILAAVKANKGHNWATGDIGDSSKEYEGILTEDQIEWFNDLVPHGEYGIHTIESVVYYPLPEKTTLYQRR